MFKVYIWGLIFFVCTPWSRLGVCKFYVHTRCAIRASSCFRHALFAGATCKNFLQDTAVLPFSTFHVGPDQPNPRPNPNPNPNPWGGSRSGGAVVRLHRVFWWRFCKKAMAAENLASTNKTNALQKVLCGPCLQIGRAHVLRGGNRV